jgi:hypothetical protein
VAVWHQRASRTIELIMTQHALDRMNDMSRFAAPPRLPIDEEVRVLHLLRRDSKEDVWMCQVQGGFLVGLLRNTRQRQMLVAMTAISRAMFLKASYRRVARHRLLVDKITFPREETKQRNSMEAFC